MLVEASFVAVTAQQSSYRLQFEPTEGYFPKPPLSSLTFNNPGASSCGAKHEGLPSSKPARKRLIGLTPMAAARNANRAGAVTGRP